MPDGSSYEVIKTEIVRSFGLTVYDYLEKFRYSMQSNETISQFSVLLTENLSKACNILDVGSDCGKLIRLTVKDLILRSVDKSLAEDLKDRGVFKINLNDVITMADNC